MFQSRFRALENTKNTDRMLEPVVSGGAEEKCLSLLACKPPFSFELCFDWTQVRGGKKSGSSLSILVRLLY
jgi:hypothetical protein